MGEYMGEKYKDYDITVVVTHRCNAKCIMCSSHEHPSCVQDELSIEDIKKIPPSNFIQITGGEPFMRTDLEEIVAILSKKAKRLMINTNGYFTDELVTLCKKYPNLAIRISIDGKRATHNSIRRIDIYDRAEASINALKQLGVSDLGISFTLQECNVDELIDMYQYAVGKGIDFGVGVVHNSFYFSKDDNDIKNKESLKSELKKLVTLQLKSKRKKDWARAYFNDMSINYIDGKPMPVRCDAGISSFTIECNGNVLPCNMTPTEWVMGNIKLHEWDVIMQSPTAAQVNNLCRKCKLNCWSICNVQSAMKKKIWVAGIWLLKHWVISD
jgi:MoaA/NifB/PqqE/SkfB family radical SAM enzyme